MDADCSVRCVQVVKWETALWRLHDSHSHFPCRWKTIASYQCCQGANVTLEDVELMSLLWQTAGAEWGSFLSLKHLHWHLKSPHIKMKQRCCFERKNLLQTCLTDWTGLFLNASQKLFKTGVDYIFIFNKSHLKKQNNVFVHLKSSLSVALSPLIPSKDVNLFTRIANV